MLLLAGFHHVAITVRDRDASVAWYARVLGLREMFREEGSARRACVMEFANGGFAVGICEYVDGPDDPFDPHRLGLDHLAFAVRSAEEMRAWAQHLDEAAVPNSGIIDTPRGQILNFKDPDDIALALFFDA